MAYVSVVQGDLPPPYSHDNTSPFTTPSPGLPETTDRDLDHVERSVTREQSWASVGGTILKSLSSAQSYERVEDDDYDEAIATPMPKPQASTSEAHPARTASVSRHLPLNHPSPDLQSLQGAYVKNVERLEESAERLSMTSSLEEELHKMKVDQRRRERKSSTASGQNDAVHHRDVSLGSISNSIIGVNHSARSGGYSPSGYITSPTGSIRSEHHAQKPRPARYSSRSSCLRRESSTADAEEVTTKDGEELQVSGRPSHDQPQRQHSHTSSHPSGFHGRPSTSASNATSRTGNNPFTDFDGVHYNARTSLESGAPSSRRISLTQPPLARGSRNFDEEQPGEKMVYYPAPVPVMLNLPQRLSKTNFTEIQKRRLKALSVIPDTLKKTAPWLVDAEDPSILDKRASLFDKRASLLDKRISMKLPPQLRASAFFDQQSTSPNIELKNGSAVATLDSILDASAHAPVNAFVDHPIAGEVGKEVYGKEKPDRKSVQIQVEEKKKRRSSLGNIFKSARSSTNLENVRDSRYTARESRVMVEDDLVSVDEFGRAMTESIAPGDDEVLDEDGQGSDAEQQQEDEPEEDEAVHQPGFLGAPTTLLAELQMRKEAQKRRNRTAADAFPNGMHSTLLELDAVTQLQQKSRKLKHVTLAWEDHEDADRKNFDDDDVPLGLLFPEKDRPNHLNMNRPLGLMEKRELEDNEPLSQRRARLQGGSTRPRQSRHLSKPIVSDGTDVPGSSPAVLDEQEEETLAQRMKRIREEKQQAINDGVAEKPENIETSGEEETLGQRRRRLKEEALKNSATPRPDLKPRRSMADILQAHPVGAPRQTSNEFKSRPDPPTRASTYGFPAPTQYPARASYINPAFGVSQNMMYPGPNQYGVGLYNYGFANSMPTMMHNAMDGPPLDPHQRAVIDRWRQGVV